MGASMKSDHNIKMRLVQEEKFNNTSPPPKMTRPTTRRTRRTSELSLSLAVAVVVLVSVVVPVINGLSYSAEQGAENNRESRKLFGGYRITPKFCKPSRSLMKNDPRARGPTICMFNHECIQRDGVVVGACMDGFLFGTCCQLGNKVENTILENNSLESNSPKPTTNAAAISYETYGGSNFEDQNLLNQQSNFMVPSSAVKVESASPASVNYDKNKHSTYLPSPSPSTYLPTSSSQSFSSELPTFISPTSSVPTTQKVDYITENSLNKITSSLLLHNENLSPPFTHSDITHGEADAVVLDAELPTADQFYGPTAAPSSDYGVASTLATHAVKVTYPKPAFKPKPTTVSGPQPPTTDKYVLVHTISNDKLPEKAPTPTNNIESIESIILMLNETKAGPQYSTSAVTETIEHRETTTTAQTHFPSTSSINYDKYGPTSFYITTKLPAPTKIPNKTAKPHVTPSSPSLQTYTVSSSLDFQNSISSIGTKATKAPTKAPLRTTPKPLVTSYISSTVIPKRPTQATTNNKRVTTRKPTKRPSPTTVKISQSPSTGSKPTKSPFVITSSTQSTKFTPTHTIVSSTPTVILIGPPKDSHQPQHPIVSIVHEDTVQISGGAITDRPHPTVHITPKPVNNSVSTVSYETPPPRIGLPSSTYGNTPFVTKRPTNTPTKPIIYEASPSSTFSDNNYNYNYYTPTTIVSTTAIYTSEHLDPTYYDQDQNLDGDKPTASADGSQNDDLISFPPVRHPGLNMSGEVYDQKPLNTPVFIEDDKLNNKMNLLVSKIVASLQNNFENLEDLVNEPNVTTSRPSNTRRPVQPVTRRPTTTTARPPQRTTARPKTTTTKRPVRVSTTTKRAVTRRPTSTPAPAPVVTRRPSPKPTTRRPKPTRRPTTTTSTEATVQDEYVEEVSEQDYEEETPVELEQGRILCGTRPQVKSGRIVGGKSAAFGEFPWQVLVRESTWLGLFTKNKCGGVLISKNYVMTAAHCQPGFLANLVAVFGEFDISGEFEKKRAVTKNVKRVIVHRNYDAATFENDLALLELESPVHFETHIVPICMPQDQADFTGRMATVSGWGRLKYGGGVPSVLQVVQVPVIENSVCQEMFQTAGHNKKILDSFLCAGYANGQRDSCEGDSGGPLVMQRPDGRWELAGTVSHGIKCAAPYLPGVYMRTTYYKPWLESITGVH